NNTLVLAGNNTYAGATTISAGTLQIGGGTASGTLGPAAVTNNANLAFNRTDSSTVANAIGGTGALYQKGTGTTVLSGVSIYTSAPLTVNGGHAIGVGYAEASGAGAANSTWNGQSVDGDAVLVRYTLAGDSNVDGKVDLTDFTFLAQNFNKSGGAQWLEGDYNYDGNVDLTDFTFLASNFNQSIAADGGG